jgi:hypothetical protein
MMKIILTALVLFFECLMIDLNTIFQNCMDFIKIQDPDSLSKFCLIVPYIFIFFHCASLWCLFQIWKDNLKKYWSEN